MWSRVSYIIAVAMLSTVLVSPVAASSASVERVWNFETVLAVAMPDDFPVASLMRATCKRLIRIERPDGSASEIQDCQLSDEPVMIAEFQGAPPSQAFVNEAGPCVWSSDYWFTVAGTDVQAESLHYTVTPSGHVHARSDYPAEPLDCD
jgi:hypothetical protein